MSCLILFQKLFGRMMFILFWKRCSSFLSHMFLIFKQYVNREAVFEHDFERPISSIFKLFKHWCKQTIHKQKPIIKPLWHLWGYEVWQEELYSNQKIQNFSSNIGSTFRHLVYLQNLFSHLYSQPQDNLIHQS